jgi:hypothetical protein
MEKVWRGMFSGSTVELVIALNVYRTRRARVGQHFVLEYAFGMILSRTLFDVSITCAVRP